MMSTWDTPFDCLCRKWHPPGRPGLLPHIRLLRGSRRACATTALLPARETSDLPAGQDLPLSRTVIGRREVALRGPFRLRLASACQAGRPAAGEPRHGATTDPDGCHDTTLACPGPDVRSRECLLRHVALPGQILHREETRQLGGNSRRPALGRDRGMWRAGARRGGGARHRRVLAGEAGPATGGCSPGGGARHRRVLAEPAFGAKRRAGGPGGVPPASRVSPGRWRPGRPAACSTARPDRRTGPAGRSAGWRTGRSSGRRR